MLTGTPFYVMVLQLTVAAVFLRLKVKRGVCACGALKHHLHMALPWGLCTQLCCERRTWARTTVQSSNV